MFIAMEEECVTHHREMAVQSLPRHVNEQTDLLPISMGRNNLDSLCCLMNGEWRPFIVCRNHTDQIKIAM